VAGSTAGQVAAIPHILPHCKHRCYVHRTHWGPHDQSAGWVDSTRWIRS